MVMSIVFGTLFIVLGVGLLWTGTGGVHFNSTHNRLFQKTAPVSSRQQTYNTVVARVFGPLGIIGGIVAIVIGVTK